MKLKVAVGVILVIGLCSISNAANLDLIISETSVTKCNLSSTKEFVVKQLKEFFPRQLSSLADEFAWNISNPKEQRICTAGEWYDVSTGNNGEDTEQRWSCNTLENGFVVPITFSTKKGTKMRIESFASYEADPKTNYSTLRKAMGGIVFLFVLENRRTDDEGNILPPVCVVTPLNETVYYFNSNSGVKVDYFSTLPTFEFSMK